METDLYTYTQASKHLGVTKQRIIYALSKLDEEQQLTQKIDNIRYISGDTIKMLKEYFDSEAANRPNNNQITSKEYKELQKQLESANNMINSLMETNGKLVNSNAELSGIIQKLTAINANLNNQILSITEKTKETQESQAEPVVIHEAEQIHETEEAEEEPTQHRSKWMFWRR